MSDLWLCADCEYENEATDATCQSCDAPKPAPAAQGDAEEDDFKHFAVGAIVACEEIQAGKKLKKLVVDVGASESVVVVTNAPNVKEGMKTVVALVGARVSSGGEDIVIKPTSVGGVVSSGMICDSGMLRWTGGGAGNAVVIPESCPIGSKPPASRPRGDQK